jgi:putative membrane protein insertion efficiency factor
MKYVSLSIAWVLRALIVAYRYGLSPVLGTNCRYEPSCSAFAQDAITAHGPFIGSWLAFKRILRCQPWGGAGYDPVPAPRDFDHQHGATAFAKTAKQPRG